MSIYKGDEKITGAGIQIDSSLSETSTNPVQNKTVTRALVDVGYSIWKKPADWPDIRSGAIDNSIYALVAHSADYTTYPEFSMYAEVQDSGTYDVYVDGIKQLTVNSGSSFTLNWQTLALTSGWDITTPSALRAHVVRITPSNITKNFVGETRRVPGKYNYGVLWVHDTIIYTHVLQLSGEFPNIRALTCSGESLKLSSLNSFVGNSYYLESIPTIDMSGNTTIMHFTFSNCPSLKKIVVKNLKSTPDSYQMGCGNSSTALEEFIFENSIWFTGEFYDMPSLKKLPSGIVFNNTFSPDIMAYNLPSLENTVMDFSLATSATSVKCNGTPIARMDGVIGVTVSPSAPFTGNSPQINVAYTGLDRAALVNLFNSMPTVTGSQICNVVGATGAADLTAEDIAIVTGKGWTLTR